MCVLLVTWPPQSVNRPRRRRRRLRTDRWPVKDALPMATASCSCAYDYYYVVAFFFYSIKISIFTRFFIFSPRRLLTRPEILSAMTHYCRPVKTHTQPVSRELVRIIVYRARSLHHATAQIPDTQCPGSRRAEWPAKSSAAPVVQIPPGARTIRSCITQ